MSDPNLNIRKETMIEEDPYFIHAHDCNCPSCRSARTQINFGRVLMLGMMFIGMAGLIILVMLLKK